MVPLAVSIHDVAVLGGALPDAEGKIPEAEFVRLNMKGRSLCSSCSGVADEKCLFIGANGFGVCAACATAENVVRNVGTAFAMVFGYATGPGLVLFEIGVDVAFMAASLKLHGLGIARISDPEHREMRESIVEGIRAGIVHIIGQGALLAEGAVDIDERGFTAVSDIAAKFLDDAERVGSATALALAGRAQ